MINSRQNPQFKEVLKLSQRKHRRRQGLFLAEGLRLVADGISAGWQPAKLVLSPPLLTPRAQETIACWDFPVIELEPELMALAGDTETSQGVMAIFSLPQTKLEDIRGNLVLILDSVRDPGNVGTLLRSASAAGVDGVVAVSGTVDFTSPKVVRSSMGGVFRVPWVTEAEVDDVISWAQDSGTQLLRLEPRDGTPFHKYEYSSKLALVVGSEADGISPELSMACTDILTIPMPGGNESLNAAMAATLVLYQAIIHRGL